MGAWRHPFAGGTFRGLTLIASATLSNVWTLAHVFATRAEEHPERALLVTGGRTSTYAQVDARSAALAAALAELGIGMGDRIAVNLPNWQEWIVTLIAAARLGATVVPLNPQLNYHELKYQLRHAEVSVAITAERFRPLLKPRRFRPLRHRRHPAAQALRELRPEERLRP